MEFGKKKKRKKKKGYLHKTHISHIILIEIDKKVHEYGVHF